jgi:quercetin dioxygenase-like cupin family protein
MQSIVQAVYHSSQVLHKSAHFHDCHQIILVINGEVDFFVNDKRLHASRGDIAIFSRYENHSALVCSKEYERFVLHIDPNVVNRKSSVYSLLTDRPTGFLNVISV